MKWFGGDCPIRFIFSVEGPGESTSRRFLMTSPVLLSEFREVILIGQGLFEVDHSLWAGCSYHLRTIYRVSPEPGEIGNSLAHERDFLVCVPGSEGKAKHSTPSAAAKTAVLDSLAEHDDVTRLGLDYRSWKLITFESPSLL